MIAALLAHHGVRAGAYLSPHLVSFAERIRIDGADISERSSPPRVGRARRATELVDRTLEAGDRVTQFEALTAAAYAELAAAGVEVAVVEAGLGGRWDATNVIDAAGRGADERRPRAHALARADDRRHRAREARRRRARRDARARRRPAPRRRRRGAARRRTAGRDDRARAGRAAAPASSSSRAAPSSGATSPSPARPPRRCLGRAGRRRRARGRGVDARAGPLRGARRRRPRRVVVLDGAHNAGGIAALAGSLPEFLAGRPLVAVVVGARRQGRRRDARRAAAAVRGRRLHREREPARAAARDARVAGRPGRAAAPASRVEADPHRALALARELAGPDGVVLSRRARSTSSPTSRAPAGARPRVDAVNREGPSALALIGAVAVIVALVILVFFAIGYGFGRLFLCDGAQPSVRCAGCVHLPDKLARSCSPSSASTAMG